jgi:Uma2 family endonuclease
MDRQGAAMPAPTGVELSREIGFEPDVLYLTRERLDRVRRRGVRGAPNIAVEVLSPGTRKRDLDTKLPAYLAHGVEEVWIVDPEARTVTIHRPGEPPESVAYGERIPSRIVDVGTGGLDRLPPPLPDDDD